jgi:hypothetical protein
MLLTASYALNAGGSGTGFPFSGSAVITGSLYVSGSGGITGSLLGTASYASTAAIQFVTNSIQSLTGIEVADFDSNTAVTFIDGVLKFIFGTPTAPSAPTATFNSIQIDSIKF